MLIRQPPGQGSFRLQRFPCFTHNSQQTNFPFQRCSEIGPGSGLRNFSTKLRSPATRYCTVDKPREKKNLVHSKQEVLHFAGFAILRLSTGKRLSMSIGVLQSILYDNDMWTNWVRAWFEP